MAINWKALLGLDKIRASARQMVDEGSVAINDRINLAKLEWQTQKIALIKAAIAVIFLVYFLFGFLFLGFIIILMNWWNTPDWHTALTSVLCFWGGISIICTVWLIINAKKLSNGFALTRRVLAEDFQDLKERL